MAKNSFSNFVSDRDTEVSDKTEPMFREFDRYSEDPELEKITTKQEVINFLGNPTGRFYNEGIEELWQDYLYWVDCYQVTDARK